MAGFCFFAAQALLVPTRTRAASPSLTVSQPNLDSSQTTNAAWLIYIGTYTGERSKGIYFSRMNRITGHLSPIELGAETPSPTFLEIDSKRGLLFAVNEISSFQGKSAGAVTSFSLHPETGKLSQLSQQSSLGGGPCHLSLDRAGHHVLVANYGGGSVAVLPVSEDGLIGPATAFVQHSDGSTTHRQAKPHAHCFNLDAANRFGFVCDLGLDKVMSYRFDSSRGTLAANEPAFTQLQPGAGPRHFAFHPDGHQAYTINELNSTLTSYAYDPGRGTLTEVQTISTLPADFHGKNFCAELQVHPNGKLLYASNRGHDSLAVFAINSADGRLSLVQHQSTLGKWPRFLGLDPSGKFLLAANQNSDSIVVFRIDSITGRLEPTGNTLDVASPVCVKFYEDASAR